MAEGIASVAHLVLANSLGDNSWMWAGNHRKVRPVLTMQPYIARPGLGWLPCVVTQACNPGTGEAEAGGLL